MLESRRRFTDHEYGEREQRVRKAMADKGIDLLIVTDPSNMCWLSGYDGWAFYVHQCLVIPADKPMFWYGRGIDAPLASLTSILDDEHIIAYPDDYVQNPDKHPHDFLANLIASDYAGVRRIGVESDNYYFSAAAMSALQSGLPYVTFIDATALVNWQRSVKSPTEISYMKAAGKIVEMMYQRVSEVLRPGLPRNELVAEIMHAATLGSDDAFGDYPAIVPLVAIGAEASACHMTWSGDALEPDTGGYLELAGVHNRYHCPCSRSVYIGEPPAKYRDIESVIDEGTERALETFKPGNTCGDVAAAFFDTLAKHGYEKDNRCGYSIGLSYPPDWGERTMSLRRIDNTELQEGMTFHFMPGMWFDDWGYEVTESVVVTVSGGERLSNVPRDIIVAHD